jgi:hypothetical protein
MRAPFVRILPGARGEIVEPSSIPPRLADVAKPGAHADLDALNGSIDEAAVRERSPQALPGRLASARAGRSNPSV